MLDSGLEEGHGEDRTQSRHTLNSLSFSLSPLLPHFSQPDSAPCALLHVFFCRPLPPSLLPPFHIFITPFPLSISPLCVDEGVGRGPHSVSHSRSINDQLEHGATQSPPSLSLPTSPASPTHTYTHTHTFQLFSPPLKTSQHFFIYSPLPFSLSLPLPPVDGSPKAHHTFS